MCWQCAAGCALPDHGVWPPPPRPPVVSSYSSSLSSGASGSELNTEQGKKEKGKEKGSRNRFKSNDLYICANIFILHLIWIYCCQNLFITFWCMVSLFPDIHESLRQEIWETLKVLWAWRVCWVVAVWIRYIFVKKRKYYCWAKWSNTLLLPQTLSLQLADLRLNSVNFYCKLQTSPCGDALIGIFSYCKAYDCEQATLTFIVW